MCSLPFPLWCSYRSQCYFKRKNFAYKKSWRCAEAGTSLTCSFCWPHSRSQSTMVGLKHGRARQGSSCSWDASSSGTRALQAFLSLLSLCCPCHNGAWAPSMTIVTPCSQMRTVSIPRGTNPHGCCFYCESSYRLPVHICGKTQKGSHLCFNSFLCLLLLCRNVHTDSDDTLMIDKHIKQMDWQIVFPEILFYDSDIWRYY